MHVLNNEVADLEAVIRQTAAVVADGKNIQDTAVPALVQRSKACLLELEGIINRVSKTCVSNRRFVTRAKAWWIEKPRLKTLQEDIHRVKASLNIALGSWNSYVQCPL
jgi:hypothetical protein